MRSRYKPPLRVRKERPISMSEAGPQQREGVPASCVVMVTRARAPPDGPHTAQRMELDETVCQRPACPHPQCWVTLRRIEQGNPRYRPPRSISRPRSQDDGGLPVLSVTTLLSSRTPQDGGDMGERSPGVPPTTAYSIMEKVFFPGVNSYRNIIAPSRLSGSCFSSKKSQKVQILNPSFQNTESRDVTMVWVPNAQRQPLRTQDREKPIKVWIKDLSLKDPPGGTKREKQNPHLMVIKKQKKPPTGGCPVSLSLVGSSPLPHTEHVVAVRDVQEQPEKPSKCRRRLQDQGPITDSPSSPPYCGIIAKNRRVVLHDTREKRPVLPHTGPVYRLDEQRSASPNGMEINMDRIRNQYYLWKKYSHLAAPSHRIRPPDQRTNTTRRSHKSMAPDQLGHVGLFPHDPDSALSYYNSQALETPTGSVVCDTTRSPDSESRNSPSLGVFSQRSWTDEEPSRTPEETDGSKGAEQEIPGARNEEAQPGTVTEAGDMAAPLPPQADYISSKSEPSDVPGDQESIIPNTSDGPPESTGESTDVHENPEQGASSPQPNPPPPSPLY
ncbi:uncharacterized protein C9orf43 homolog isoform X2 [Bufo bufo]|uniref:uncharacterized protein C9orf43 homolog isoform X2 n=1 Tax=Bufo bufo TaxID=8384 RepID=UPI001ABDB8D7|nr:uncharacterized protein C9orf43 homolog isoform X2 [Bufo bufo]